MTTTQAVRKSGRYLLLLAMVAALPTTRLQAQNTFEGVITATSTVDGDRTEMIMRVKGNRWRLEMEMDGEPGVIVRGQDGRMMAMMPASRQYAYMPSVAGGDAMQFTATGRSETVAGYPCQYFRIRDPNGVQDGDQACITTALGFVGFGGGSPLASADETAIRAQFKDGFLILKSLDRTGAVDFVVSKVERTPVSDAMFLPPPGFTEVRHPGPGAHSHH